MTLPLDHYPFTPKGMEINGRRLSYLDQGQGPVLVMLHGNPSWSYLYRNLVLRLQDRFRIIVPDHMGCGLSDKPQEYAYTLRTHIDNLTILLERLGIETCTLVVHDWGGAIGMGWAVDHVPQVEKICVFNTAAFLSSRIPRRIALCRIPLLGKIIVQGLNGFAWPATWMAVTRKMTKEVAAGFLYPYDSWAHRIATHAFVRDIPLKKTHRSWQELARIDERLALLAAKPMLICWGGRDFCFNDHFYQEWQRRFPGAESHYFPEAGHYILEDAFAQVAPLVEDFFAK
ncbi:MAG: alpha/beta fold hydrolase [Desulfurivibrionaceae bacterium]|nr:alpha/beta fold hydrolase [Desulfurivibrionaceae bacterium]